MNLRNWSKEHTKGLLVGIATIGVGVFIVIFILSKLNGFPFSEGLSRFSYKHDFIAKVISLAAIGNLPWFHFSSLKTSNWAFGQGIIMATVLDLLVMIFFKFII
ncbi:MAG: hypothetical protein M9916_01115 [Crocinitomicaceae bacterium]|nr:hypothetical protein [Crocinitomicaceae bacterium]